ncbi:glycosyltransferase involved in cell wall biosynthesis [Natronobacillus azotifigens]|uniref:Glycosyltransferase n=1 Tax=Natronobacillus azotifigens TaxID=472978 RepID=A0A9J6REB6_9BACI|nr:glycosyltransferase [Natronobacillus azotifigens]
MSKAKRVVHITTVHHPFDTRIYHKECMSLKEAGYEVYLVAPSISEGSTANNDINIIPIKKYKNRMLRMLISTFIAFKAAKKLNADYYHVHDPELLHIAKLLKNSKNVVVYDVHEDYVTSIMQKKYLPKLVRKFVASCYQFIENKLTKKIELCLAEKYYSEKYQKGTCILNYPIIGESIVNRDRDTLKSNNRLLYTGNVSEDRGAIIQARLPNIINNISVVFVGKCSIELAKKMKDIADYQDNKIELIGVNRFVERTEIDDMYRNEDWLAGLALFPPTDHYMKKELTKFFEYMSAGIPIICSDFPVWKAFIQNHKCGIAVNPFNDKEIKDAIKFMQENPEQRKEMGENGKNAVINELNWYTEEKKLIKWYDQLWLQKVSPGRKRGEEN